MSKKQGLRKIFAMLTVFTMVFAVTVNVSAATHSTSTSYNLDGSTVTVRSEIKDIDPNEEVTYLAYNTLDESGGEGPTSENIIYIDQKNADKKTTMMFEYTANCNEIGSTKVKFGAEKTQVIVAEGFDTINAVRIGNVDINGTGTVSPTEYVIAEDCTFTITPVGTQQITAMYYSNGGQKIKIPLGEVILGQTESYYTPNKDLLNENYILYVEFGTVAAAVKTTVARAEKFGTPVLDQDDNNEIVGFSKVTIKPEDEETCEYGVLFSYEPYSEGNPLFTGDNSVWAGKNVAGEIKEEVVPDEENGGSKTIKTGVKKFRALGKGLDGTFAVQLIDNGSGYLTGMDAYYLTPYVVLNGKYDEAQYGASKKFSLNDE